MAAKDLHRAWRLALANAVATRNPAPGVIFHSDGGCPYTSAQFTGLARDYQVVLSLGRTGQCYDSAIAESVFASLKRELIDTRPWPTQAAARHHRRIRHLVQRHPTAQRPLLPQPRRIRSHNRPGDHQTGSLIKPSSLSIKAATPLVTSALPSIQSLNIMNDLAWLVTRDAQ